VTLEDWAAALIETALPRGLAAGRKVILGCDEETVRLAGAQLGLREPEALVSLVAVARERWRISERNGLRRVESDARAFRQTPRPRRVPPHVVALAFGTIAASRMSPSDGLSTRHYYPRLLGLLEIGPGPSHPPVEGFGGVIQWWSDLAEWLRNDQQGERGLLDHHSPHHQPYVTSCIRQVVFRDRDQRHLDGFYAEQRGSLDAGWNARRLLLSWGGRHRLTKPAHNALEDSELAEQVDAALRSGYRAWDGSLVDERGVRLWPGLLQLYADPKTVVLGLICKQLRDTASAHGPDGPLTLAPYPEASAFSTEWLKHLCTGNVRLTLDGRREAVVIPGGGTLLFEQRGDGLERVPGGDEKPLWVLSRDELFLQPWFADRRQQGGSLPDGWVLVHAVTPDELPETMRRETRPDVPQIELRGGLDLGGGSYLIGFPPRLFAGPVPERLDVRVGGVVVARLRGGEHLSLDRVCAGPGVYAIEAGDFQQQIELVHQGRRQGSGGLRWDLGNPVAMRGGASRHGRDASFGPLVCGAALDGVAAAERDPVLHVRTRAAVVHVLYRNGSVSQAAIPAQPGWAREFALPAPTQVKVIEPENAVWLCLADQQPRVRRLSEGEIEITGAVVAVCELFQRAQVQPSEHEAAWKALCATALGEEVSLGR
jgi:hypothetical protein